VDAIKVYFLIILEKYPRS